MTNVVFAILYTNTFVMEVRSPSGFSKSDHVFVTNEIGAHLHFPVLNVTNSIVLVTNVERYGWRLEPLRMPRRPLNVSDQPPMPPGVTNAFKVTTNTFKP